MTSEALAWPSTADERAKRRVLGSNRIGPGAGAVTAYVDGARYHGDPRQIVLRSHEDIQLDVGAPAVPPQPVNWSTAEL